MTTDPIKRYTIDSPLLKRSADGLQEYYYTDSPRLQRYIQLLESGFLSLQVVDALGDLSPGFLVIRPGPLIRPSAPGAFSCSMQFDLSDRAIELLVASGADVHTEA